MSVAIFILEEKLGIEVIMNCFLMCLVLLCARPDCPAPAADSDGVSLEKKNNWKILQWEKDLEGIAKHSWVNAGALLHHQDSSIITRR